MGQPTWRRAFDTVERAVGRPLEQAVESSRYVDALVLGLKVQGAVNRTVRRTVDRQIGAVLHLVNVPTRSDVRRLSRQVTTLTGEVRRLALTADDLQRAAAALQEDRADEARRDA